MGGCTLLLCVLCSLSLRYVGLQNFALFSSLACGLSSVAASWCLHRVGSCRVAFSFACFVACDCPFLRVTVRLFSSSLRGFSSWHSTCCSLAPFCTVVPV